jgi:hypothetical protein
MDDKHARLLLDRARRVDIYRQLNPWDVSFSGDNCPTAADALFHFLAPLSGQQTSITRCLPPNPQGYTIAPGVHFRRATLQVIIDMVRNADPGFVVVVHGIRPPGAVVGGHRMVPDHYFCMVKLGPPQNDAFWADCSRPDLAMFYPSQSQTPPGAWDNTIESMARYNQLRHFEYTAGPYSVRAVVERFQHRGF